MGDAPHLGRSQRSFGSMLAGLFVIILGIVACGVSLILYFALIAAPRLIEETGWATCAALDGRTPESAMARNRCGVGAAH